MVNKRQIKEAEETIDLFKKKFYGKYGVWPIVTFAIAEPKLKVNSFAEAEDIVNTIMNKREGHTHKIRDRVRMRSVVEYRQVLFKILSDLGYTFTSIADHFGYDHATVIYSKNSIEKLLETKNYRIINIVTILENELKEQDRPIDNL
jgi:chromosomal replication initiation ATPase DnaA